MLSSLESSLTLRSITPGATRSPLYSYKDELCDKLLRSIGSCESLLAVYIPIEMFFC